MEEELNREIAIIGMAGRFPGAANVKQFWHNLRNSVESVRFFSDEELAEAGVSSAVYNQPNYVKARAILDDIKLFDAHFFGFNPREAEILDVQQRLFLETAWQALEESGYISDTGSEIVGVYAGSGWNSYLFNNLGSNRVLIEDVGGYQVMISNDKDFLATRVAYKLNLKGPAVAVQTACSTSLVAIHLACQSLLNGECDIALAGGVTVSVPQQQGYLYQPGMILSPDGHCRAFDEAAAGTVGGDGVGVIVLKPLEDALEDGDYIHAIIKGSAINNDGGLKVGYTAPSEEGQTAVIQEALDVAGLIPEDISYIEAHGTGTKLGDPIELAALHQLFGSATEKWCGLGSVKTNIGHLDSAAGVAGVIKTVLALKAEEIPATLHFQKINREIDFDQSAFYINDSLRGWPKSDSPRRAGVSSFGIGGTNAHLILEEAAEEETPLVEEEPPMLLTLSAKTEIALKEMVLNLEQHLKVHPEQSVTDVAYTLAHGRRVFPYRSFSVVSSREKLMKYRLPMQSSRLGNGRTPTVAFLFSGQGAQYMGMAAGLYQHEPVFRRWFDRCDQISFPLLGVSLLDLVFPKEENEFAKKRLQQTEYTQPALFAVEYALAQLWLSWGVRPTVMMGHSLGEYVAACVADVFSLEDAITLVVSRGRLMQSVAPGKMMAVMAPVGEVSIFLPADVSIAAVNSVESFVVSGRFKDMEHLEEILQEKGISVIYLRTSHAFHSSMMDPILDSFLQQVDKIALSEPKIPFVSNVTGRLIKDGVATSADYWVTHIREGVLFADGLNSLFEMGVDILLEVGPGQTLKQLVEQHPQIGERVALNSLPKVAEKREDYETTLEALGVLWQSAVSIDWFAFYNKKKYRRVPLPTYPFQRTKHWVEPRKHQLIDETKEKVGKRPLSEWGYIPSWSRKPLLPKKRAADGAVQSWLLFIDELGIGAQLGAALQEKGDDVYLVSRGMELLIGEEGAVIPIESTREDFQALFDSMDMNGRLPTNIVYGWLVDGEKSRLTDAIQLGLHIPVQLMQGWGEREESLTITFMTNNSMELAGELYLDFSKNLVLGPLRVIPLEYMNVQTRLVDFLFDDEQKGTTPLLNELLFGHDEIVVYRNQQRWVEQFVPIPEISLSEESSLREGGVYLITGGLGGIGLTIAEYLVEKVKATLILTSRTTFPDDSEWENLLQTNDIKHSVKQRIEKIKKLKEQTTVWIRPVDVSDVEGMTQLIDEVREQFGALNGVVHTAGIPGGGIIQLREKVHLLELLKAKVDGTILLSNLLGDQPELDFILICSSISSVLGSFGQVAYCAANAFADGFARAMSREGKTIISVNWDSWQDVGMAAAAGFDGDGIAPKEGKILFEWAVTANYPQLIISTNDLKIRQQEMKQPLLMPLEVEELATDQKYPRPEIAIEYLPPENEVEEIVASFYSSLLGIEPVGRIDDFFLLGGHSLLAIRLLSRVNESFDFAPTLPDFFKNPTIAYVAEQILFSQIDQLDDFEAMLDEIENE